MSKETIVSVKNLSLEYRKADGSALVVLDQLALDLTAGEILAVLGPSGSGKSSLLEAIAGIAETATGEIYYAGELVSELPSYRRGFALMFQDGQLFDHLSVFENIAYPLKIRKTAKPEIRQTVLQLLADLDLNEKQNSKVTELSGGQQQRVAFARVLASKPRMLLLDEPFAALDSELRTRLATELRTWIKARQIPAIFVTHDQAEAQRIADRVLYLHQGKLVSNWGG